MVPGFRSAPKSLLFDMVAASHVGLAAKQSKVTDVAQAVLKPDQLFPANLQITAEKVRPVLGNLPANGIFKDVVQSQHGTTFAQSEVQEQLKSEEANRSYLEGIRDELVSKSGSAIKGSHSPLSKAEARKIEASMLQLASKDNAKKYLQRALSVSQENGKHADTEAIEIVPQDEKKMSVYAKKHAQIRKRDDATRKAIQEITASQTTPEEKCRLLEELLYQSTKGGKKGISGIDRFNSHELKEIFFALWNNQGYNQMVEVMYACKNAKFKDSPLNLEIFAHALIKSAYFNPHVLEELGNELESRFGAIAETFAIKGLADRTVKMHARVMLEMMELYDNGNCSEEVRQDYEKMVTTYKAHTENGAIRKEDVQETYITYLASSISNLQRAFERSLDPRYGHSLMLAHLEQWNLEEAQDVAQIVEFCCQRDGGIQSDNFSILRALYESSLLLEKPQEELKDIELLLLSKITTPQNADRCIRDMTYMEMFLKGHESEATIKAFKAKVELHKEAIENPKTRNAVLEQSKKDAEKVLEGRIGDESKQMTLFKSYAGEFSNWRSGNWKFGGQLPESNINRYDRGYFGELLRTPLNTLLAPEELPDGIEYLMDAKDVETFFTVASKIIRAQYNTQDLERYDEKHDLFDATVHGYMAVSGAGDKAFRKYLPDSRTNVAEHFDRGIGDCRAHTQSLQIMYEIWKEERCNQFQRQIMQIYQSSGMPREKVIREIFAIQDEMDKVLQTPMKFIDVEVHLPVRMKDGKPMWNGDRMVLNPSKEQVKVEEHTFNLILTLDENGKPGKMRTADSFYNNTYPWANQEISFEGRDFQKEGYTAGSVELFDESTGELVRMPITIKPTAYTGKQSVYSKNSETVRFMGLPVAPRAANKTLLEKREDNKQEQKLVRQFYEQTSAAKHHT